MISVLIADDHDGLGRLIGALEDIEVLGVAGDGAEAVERCRERAPDVVLMDLDMPRMDGIEATRRITEGHPGTAVLILTSLSNRSRILGALSAGACGYVLKDASSAEVANCIEPPPEAGSPTARRRRCGPSATATA